MEQTLQNTNDKNNSQDVKIIEMNTLSEEDLKQVQKNRTKSVELDQKVEIVRNIALDIQENLDKYKSSQNDSNTFLQNIENQEQERVDIYAKARSQLARRTKKET